MNDLTPREALSKAHYYLMLAASSDSPQEANKYIRIAQTYVEIGAMLEDLDE